MYLAIDSASATMSLALHDGHNVLAEQSWRCGNQHNTLLAPSIQQIFAVCSVKPEQLRAVAVAKGPGSYTGLRIGIALAKGLAAARDLPLYSASCLDIVAQGAPVPIEGDEALVAVIPAGRGRIIHARYAVREGRWVADGEASIGTWDALLPTLAEGTRLSGEIEDAGHEALRQYPALRLIAAPHRLRRAAVLAQMCADALAETPPEQWPSDFASAQLTPIYLNTASVPG